MVIATHHEGDIVHLDPMLDIIILGVGQGKVRLGISLARSGLASQVDIPPQERPSPEGRTATIAFAVAQSDHHLGAEMVSCELHGGLVTVRGRAPSYYLSQPGRSPMLVVICEESQRIRINDAVDIVVLDIHDHQKDPGPTCPPSIRYQARRLVDRLRRVDAVTSPQPLLGSPRSETAFSL